MTFIKSKSERGVKCKSCLSGVDNLVTGSPPPPKETFPPPSYRVLSLFMKHLPPWVSQESSLSASPPGGKFGLNSFYKDPGSCIRQRKRMVSIGNKASGFVISLDLRVRRGSKPCTLFVTFCFQHPKSCSLRTGFELG